jgi:hypothetical protein
MVGGRGQAVLRGQVAIHDRGLRALGGVVDRVRVLEPGGVPGELAEARIANGVEAPAGVHQGVRGKLVEQHHHDRGPRDPADRARLRLLGKGQLRDRVREEKEGEEHERSRREHAQERAHRLGAGIQAGHAAADRDRQEDQDQVGGIEGLLQRLGGDERDERSQEDQVDATPRVRGGQADEQLHGEQHKRRHDHQQHGEADHVEARGASSGKELRVVLEQVEERLGDREGPEDGQLEKGPERALAPFGALRPVLRGLGGAHPRLSRAK